MSLFVTFFALLVLFQIETSKANPVRHKLFSLRDKHHNQYLNVEDPGSQILHLVETDEDIQSYSAHKSKLSDLTSFKGCRNFNDLNEIEDEICVYGHGNEDKRLYYDTKHKVFIFLDQQYKTEDRLICHIRKKYTKSNT